MIHMRDVSKIYENGAVALDHVNVDIEAGDFVFIVGASGAGKSTFIKMLFREELPTSGSLFVNGRDVVHMKRSEVPYLRRGLGVIFQDYRLLPDKTVFENVAFAMQVIERRGASCSAMSTPCSTSSACATSSAASPRSSRAASSSAWRLPAPSSTTRPSSSPMSDGQPRPGDELGHHGHLQSHQPRRHDHRDGTHDKTIVDTMQRRVIAIEDGHIVRDEAKGGYGYEA